MREAIIAANAITDPDDHVVINLQGGTYEIERNQIQGGIGDTELNFFQDPFHGDFDIRRSMQINGDGAIIRGERLGRVFQISGDVEVTMHIIQIQNGGGAISAGAGIHVSGGADVTLNDVSMFNNVTSFSSAARGGAIYANNAGGSIIVNRGEYSSNVARGGIAGNGTAFATTGAFTAGGAVLAMRSRSRQVGALRLPDGTYVPGSFAAYHVAEQVSELSRPDVAGGSYTTDGTNFPRCRQFWIRRRPEGDDRESSLSQARYRDEI